MLDGVCGGVFQLVVLGLLSHNVLASFCFLVRVRVAYVENDHEMVCICAFC